MKKFNRYLSLMVAMIMMIGTMGVQKVQAATNIPIEDVRQSKNELKNGDSFGLYITVGVSIDQLEVIEADFGLSSHIVSTGNYDNKTLFVTSPQKDGENASEIYIGDLKYIGKGSNETISFIIKGKVGAKEERKDATANIDVTLKTEEVSDGEGSLKLKDTSQVSIVAGETKKVDILVENTSTSTVKKPSISVGLEGEKVEGILIKGGKNISVSSISPKSSSKISFEIETSKAVKAGNYKLQFDLAGKIETVSLRVTSDFMPPQLEFSIEGLGEVTPGVAQPVKIKVHNVGDSEAKQVKVELENKEEVAIVGGSNVKYISSIPAQQSAYVNYTVRIAPGFKQNMLPIKINYTYQDEIGESYEDKVQYIYIPLKGGVAGSGEVVIQNIISPGSTVGVGRNFNVKFTLAALKGNAKNVQISVSAENPEAIVPHSQNLFMIQEVKQGTKKQYAVTMSATANAQSQSYPIRIEVSYDSAIDGEQITFKQYSSVNIYNPKAEEEKPPTENEEDDKKGQPKVIIGEYKVTPTIAKAGEEFGLEIGFLNTNSIKSVHNLKASLTVRDQGENDAGNVFTPVNASNTFFISALTPGETATKYITMYTIPNALPKTYQVQLELEYEDSKGNQITATESIGIPVEQTTRVDIAEIEMDIFTMGMPMPLNISLYNTGKTNISNLMIHTEGEGFSVQDNKMFVGSFEKGASEYYSPTIIPEMPGMLSGTIVVEYEEATGELVEIRKDFDFEVMEMMEEFPDDMGEMPFPEDENKSKMPLIAGIIAVIAAAIITAVVIRRKRKKEENEIELDLNE